MKKIGIVTLFGYDNYGNRLQMFAVQQVYKKMGFHPEIIRYIIDTPRDPILIRIKIILYRIIHLRSEISKSILERKRISTFKKHAVQYYTETRAYVNPVAVPAHFHVRYSFVSVGSDQIWGGFTHSIADFVFLKFAPQEKRITFSPSFGSAEIDAKYESLFRTGLAGFASISVREESGAELVQKLTGKTATVLCDPTMCLPKEDWLAFAKPHAKKPRGKYILTYFLGEKAERVCKLVSNLSEDYEIVHLNSFDHPDYYAASPSEWVDFVNDAQLLLTDSFHAVVFSIILRTPFAVYRRIGGESMNTRIINILNKFDLMDRYEIDEKDDTLFDLSFSSFTEIITQETNKLMDFLQHETQNEMQNG